MENYSINTPIGYFTGNKKENCIEYLGIKYANASRFEYATLIDSYNNPVDATKPAPSSMQKRAWSEFEHLEIKERAFYHREFRDGIKFEYSEDGLNLNIFAPLDKDNCPVIVFFHGGGFDSGSINESPFNGEGLSKRGNVVVFVQYRVGVFGYLTNEEIFNKYSRDGNFGLDDMMQSLVWIRKNISYFGGDKDNITLMGQSAGAMSIQYLLCSRKADTLFDKAIMMSGAGLFPKFSLPRPFQKTREYWNEVIALSGCANFEEFKKLPAKKVLEAVEKQKTQRKDNTYNTMPVIDGYILEDGVDKLIKHARDLPLIVGYTNNDMFTFLLAHITRKYAKAHNGYVYYFDIDAKGDSNQAFHSSDVRYMLGTLSSSWRPYTEHDYQVSNAMMDYVSSFAKTGNPNVSFLPTWERNNGKALCFTDNEIKMDKVKNMKLIKNTFNPDPT